MTLTDDVHLHHHSSSSSSFITTKFTPFPSHYDPNPPTSTIQFQQKTVYTNPRALNIRQLTQFPNFNKPNQ
jgi:hypothetical protein